MKLGETLRYMFPDADFKEDIIVRDRGNGPFIEHWGLPDPQPTQAELQAAYDQLLIDRQLRADTEQQVRDEANTARTQLRTLLDLPNNQWTQNDVIRSIKFIIRWLKDRDLKT